MNDFTYDYGTALRSWAFVQEPLISWDQFHRDAAERGLMHRSALDRKVWETLDREQLLPPVVYALHGFTDWDQQGDLESGDLMVRDEVGFKPWEELEAESKRRHEEATRRHGGRLGWEPRFFPLYSRWQLISLALMLDALTPSLPESSLRFGFDEFEAQRRRAAERLDRDRLRDVAAECRREELVITRTQNLFLPAVRGGRYVGSQVKGLTEDTAHWAISQRDAFDGDAASEAARECGLDAAGLVRLYERLANRAYGLDPLARWIHLVEMIKRRQRERVQGVLLRALDLYDAARIIRGWHSYLAEEPLPDVDELFGLNAIEFKRRHFGTRDLRGNRGVLPQLLEDYGLYPWRVQLIAEGPSEIAMLEELLEQQWDLTFAQLGIHPISLGGADIPENAELLLAAMRPYANYYYLLFDNEGRAAELIQALQQAGTIEGVSDQQRRAALKRGVEQVREMSFETPEQRAAAMRDARERSQRLEEEPGEAPEFFRWKQNLEEDNFTVNEMCGVINAYANDKGVEGFTLAPERAQQAIDHEQERPAKQRRGVATILVDLCELQDPPLALAKVELARLLARYAIDHRELDGRERPILVVAEHLLRLTIADRRLQGELR